MKTNGRHKCKLFHKKSYHNYHSKDTHLAFCGVKQIARVGWRKKGVDESLKISGDNDEGDYNGNDQDDCYSHVANNTVAKHNN